jgi:glyoxylase I family protein
MLNTAYESDKRPAAPDPTRIKSHEDICLFFGCKDLDAAYQHLRANGVSLKEPKVAPYGMKQLSFKDPDGYGICLQWPANQKWQEEWEKTYGIERETIA